MKTVIGESIVKMEDLTTPSSTQLYKLGKVIAVEDSGTKVTNRYMYMKAHTGLTAYQPYVISFGATAGAEVITAAPPTGGLGAPGCQVVVPKVAVTTAYYFWGLIEGEGSVLMTAETYAVGDFLQVITAGTAMVVDGTTGATTFSANTCPVCRAAGTTAVAKAMYLINRYAVIAAS